jgi:hypothetical protein
VTIFGADNFAVFAYQQDLQGAPLETAAATGSDPLDVAQKALTIGGVVPVVFARRFGNIGGVLISPEASEARFENSATNEVTARYRLVLGEGRMASVQLRDLFQRSCRVGTLQQTYGRAAGTWEPGNFIVHRVGYNKPECPYFCGTGGSYDGLTTASFAITVADGDTRWDRQVHLFIREGIEVARLIDGFTGPTNNFADAALWMHHATSRAPAELIDTDAYLIAARFTEAMGFTFDCKIDKSTNFEDFIAENGKYFLLTKSRRGGRIGLRPTLPITAGNAVSTDPVTPLFRFDESQVVPDSLEIDWTPLTDRQAFCAVMLWRQQPESGIGLVRSTEVRYPGTALSGPFEQHDLSSFATAEIHAVRVGAALLARRRHVTHTARLKARPHSSSQALVRGDIVQVKLARTALGAEAGGHNYLYEIERIGKAANGELAFELTHFPVDSQCRSLVAMDVMSATASGVLLPTGFNAATISCDANSADDTTLAPDVGSDRPDYTDAGNAGGMGGFSGEAAINPGIEAPVALPDPLDKQTNLSPVIAEEARVGDVLTAPDCDCADSSIQWYRGTAFGANPTPIPGATSGTYTVGIVDGGMGVFAVITCVGDGSVCTSQPVPIRGWKLGVAERNDLGAEMTVRGLTTTYTTVALSNCAGYPGVTCNSYNLVNPWTSGDMLGVQFISIELAGDFSYPKPCGGAGADGVALYARGYNASGSLVTSPVYLGGWVSNETTPGCGGTIAYRIPEIVFQKLDGTVVEPPLPSA